MKSPKQTVLNTEGYDIPLFIDEYRLKLDSNENMFGPSPRVVDALRNITSQDIKLYPAYGEIINRLADLNNVSAEMILPTSGADEGINYIFDTFIEPKDTVLTVTPSFAMPKIYAKINGCTYNEVNYREKFNFPIDDILANITEKTKLIIVTTPNNPTGEAISRENMLNILDKAGDRYILIDETYVNYAEESFIDLLKTHENIFITRSLSKDYALAGLRFGYIISSQKNIEYIKRLIRPYSVNIAAVKAACAAVDDKEYINSVVSDIKTAKNMLIEALTPMAVKIYPSNANFLLVDFGDKAEFIYKKLLKSGIIVKNFGKKKDLENCLRITIPPVKDAEYLINTLKQRKLIVFDMDGVIVDTRNSYRIAIQSTFEFFAGKNLTSEEIQTAKNIGGLNNDWDLTEYLLKQAGFSPKKDDIIEKFQEIYWGNEGTGVIFNEALLISAESVKKLAESFDLAVFTGRPKLEADFVLKRWGLENYFYPVITMDDLSADKQKPSPDGLLQIINIVNPLETYYLGDTHDDMISGKAAGVNPIGVLPPQDKTEELKNKMFEFGAKNVLQNTEDVVKLVHI